MPSTKFAHHAPSPWAKGAIKASMLSHRINQLIDALSSESFDRQPFQDLYLSIHQELEEGTGVIFVPDSAFKKLNKTEKKEVFLKFSEFMGQAVPLNKAGELIREVKDTGLKDSVEKPARGHLTDQSLAFHSDRADITAMVCESVPEQGGEFKICSSANLLAALRAHPEALKVLTSDIPHDLRDEGNSDAEICYHPIISEHPSFVVRYIRKFVDSIVRHGMTVDPKIAAALHTVDTILNTEGFFEEIHFNPGDFIFFNNHITLHARNAFINSEDKQRCLLRIWIASEFTRPLPDSFKPIFHSVEAGSHRGGVVGQ